MREMASRTKSKLNNLNYRAREVGLTERLEQSDIDALKAFYDFTCLKCGFNPAISPDHVLPLSKGGANSVDNLQLLCDSCNKSKGDDETDYRQGRILTREIVADLAKSEPKKEYKRHNWDEIRFDYETTDLSLRDLAKKYGLVDTLLFKRSAAENWVKSKEKFGSELVADIKREAKAKDVSARVMILEAARIALEEWKQSEIKSDLAQLSKILELAARVEGFELDRRTLTVKDWRDVGRENNQNPDELEQYFSELESATVSQLENGEGTELGAGWSD